MQAMLPPLFQPLPRSPRPDTETSKVVEMGVRLQQSHGRAFASEFLVRRSIQVPVIQPFAAGRLTPPVHDRHRSG